jgi:hypothetical protein
MQVCQRLMGTSPRPPAKGARSKVLLVNSGKYLSNASLERPVGYTRNTQRAFLLLPGLWNIHSPYVRRLIPLAVHGLQHFLNPFPKALLRLRHRLPIYPGR